MNVRLTYTHKQLPEVKMVIEIPKPSCMRFDEQHSANMIAVDIINQTGAKAGDWFYAKYEDYRDDPSLREAA